MKFTEEMLGEQVNGMHTTHATHTNEARLKTFIALVVACSIRTFNMPSLGLLQVARLF